MIPQEPFTVDVTFIEAIPTSWGTLVMLRTDDGYLLSSFSAMQITRAGNTRRDDFLVPDDFLQVGQRARIRATFTRRRKPGAGLRHPDNRVTIEEVLS